MLLFAPTVSADELVCEVSRDGSPHRYLINIDDRRSTVSVVDPDDTNRPYSVTVGELRPERALKEKSGPSHHPMFWLFLEAAAYRYEGSCRVAPPHPGG